VKIPLVLLQSKYSTCGPIDFVPRLGFWTHYMDCSLILQLNKLTKKHSNCTVSAPVFLSVFCKIYTFCSFDKNVFVFLRIRRISPFPSFSIHFSLYFRKFDTFFEHCFIP